MLEEARCTHQRFFLFVRWKTTWGTKSNYLLRLMATINIFFLLRNNEIGFNEKSYVEYSLMLYNTCYTCKTKNIYIIQITRRFLFETVFRVLRIYFVLSPFYFRIFEELQCNVYYQSLTPYAGIHLVSKNGQVNEKN